MLPLLAALAVDPSPLTRRVIADNTAFVVRGLRVDDSAALTAFLAGLSDTSRRYWHGHTDHDTAAADWIEGIGRYDKLRLVTHEEHQPHHLDGVVDLSFALPEHAEGGRYARYGITLDPDRTVRFGPCVADAWQGRGLAAQLLEPTWDAVRMFHRDHVILFGGVHADNRRARRFYGRHGFVEAGASANGDGEIIDMMLRLPPRSRRRTS